MSREELAKLHRIADANLNRLREALRVLEDIQRYLFDNKGYSLRFKELRHSLKAAYDINRLQYRDIKHDVAKSSTDSELRRKGVDDLLIANFARAQESSRVLEEVFKLFDIELSSLFKNIRYELYQLEKELLGDPKKNSTSNSKNR